MIVESASDDIVYTNAITGVLGNYLKPSLVRAGLDPDNLATADASKMNFGAEKPKAWSNIWGSGQGIGAVKAIVPTATLVDRLDREYHAARARLGV
jgi:nitronate monooxygenase